MLHPDWNEIASGAMPRLPQHDAAKYWFMAVSILGASISPYLSMFYSSRSRISGTRAIWAPIGRLPGSA
ncbi:divalent metal cation transporter [Mesorhizobium sp. NFR06]|uniref:divalent metal cation transporter n=1 Tax=Mesorhizobium sp. NFR06 TaxID=1566290 RepID=UPI001FCE4349|nr:divalent metal cation transporter [Mesorhizobium sp. NFR06]